MVLIPNYSVFLESNKGRLFFTAAKIYFFVEIFLTIVLITQFLGSEQPRNQSILLFLSFVHAIFFLKLANISFPSKENSELQKYYIKASFLKVPSIITLYLFASQYHSGFMNIIEPLIFAAGMVPILIYNFVLMINCEIKLKVLEFRISFKIRTPLKNYFIKVPTVIYFIFIVLAIILFDYLK